MGWKRGIRFFFEVFVVIFLFRRFSREIWKSLGESADEVRKVVYPSVVVWSKLRFFYKVAFKTGVLNALPLVIY